MGGWALDRGSFPLFEEPLSPMHPTHNCSQAARNLRGGIRITLVPPGFGLPGHNREGEEEESGVSLARRSLALSEETLRHTHDCAPRQPAT